MFPYYRFLSAAIPITDLSACGPTAGDSGPWLRIYGVTVADGSDARSSRGGCGTVLSIIRSGSVWNKATLHEFSGYDGKTRAAHSS